MLCGTAMAQTEFDFDNDGLSLFGFTAASSNNSNDGDFTEDKSCTKDGITITVSPSGGNTANRIWSGKNVLRMYGGKLTVKSANGKMSKIEITQGKWNNNNAFTPPSSGSTASTWEGSSEQVELAVAGNTQMSKITVYLEGSDSPEPEPLPEVASIAEFKALDVKAQAVLTLTNAQVLYKNGKDMYVKDATGAIDFYNCNMDYTAGQLLNGTLTATYDLYNNLPELLTSPADVELTATDGGEVTPTVITADEAANHVCEYVVLKNASVTKEGNNYYANGIQIYDKFRVLSEGITGVQDVAGILIAYKDIYEICPIEDIFKVTYTEDFHLSDVYDLGGKAAGVTVVFDNAKVVYVEEGESSNSVYLREGDLAMLFYRTTLPLPLNATVSGKVKVDIDVYNGLIELKENTDTNADELTITESEEQAEPREVTIEDLLDVKYMNDLVVVKNASIVTEGEESAKPSVQAAPAAVTYWAQVGEAKIQLYGNDAVVSELAGTETGYDIEAIVGNYKGTPQLKPLKAEEYVPDAISAVRAENANAPLYNLAGQRVDASFKGIVVKDGKKYVQK